MSESSSSSRTRSRTLLLALAASLAGGCGAELATDGPSGATEDRLSIASTAWQLPFTATSWRIGFDVYNPALAGQTSSCFGTTMDRIKHAGEDWAGTTATVVGAIGAGVVVFANLVNYPGHVVVIRHDLSDAERRALGLSSPVLYSQYGHLTGLAVRSGDRVGAGQRLGTLHNQGSNTHLHWEVRSAEKPPLCGTTFWGPGYTGPGTTATSYGYLSPSGSVRTLAGGTPSACPGGDGLYCGGNGVTGAANILYRCTDRKLTYVETCAKGCDRRPPGYPDRCK